MRFVQNGLLYGILVFMVLKRGMSIPDFVLYIGLVRTFSESTADLFSTLIFTNMNKLQMDDFRTFMDWIEEEPDLEKEEGTITDIDLKQYEFTFENVSFRYPGHEKYVLKNLNIKIDAGMKLAVVGVNGAGKTTLTKLLMRLYEPTEGRILLNGIDIKKYDRSTYYQLFSPVFQNVEVFACPVWENVSLKERERTDMDFVMKSLENSGMEEKIQTYKEGVETQLLRRELIYPAERDSVWRWQERCTGDGMSLYWTNRLRRSTHWRKTGCIRNLTKWLREKLLFLSPTACQAPGSVTGLFFLKTGRLQKRARMNN